MVMSSTWSSISREIADGRLQALHHFGSRRGPARPDGSQRALDAERDTVTVLRLHHTVGDEHDQRPFRKALNRHGAVTRLPEEPERNARAVERVREGALAVEDVPGRVAGTRVGELPGPGVDRHEESRDELLVERVLEHHMVGERQDPCRVGVDQRNGTQVGVCLRHHERRVERMAAHIADDDARPAVHQWDVVEEVAAGRVGHDGLTGDVQPAVAGGRVGQEALLDEPGQLQLALALGCLPRLGDVLSDRDEVGDGAGRVAHRCDRLL